MSELEQGGAAADEPTNTAPAAVSADTPAPAVAVPAQPAPKAAFADRHTAETTTMNDPVKPKDSVIKALSDEALNKSGFLNIFLGNSKKEILAAQELISRWLQVQAIRDLFEEDRVDQIAVNTAESTWGEFIEANFPGANLKSMEVHAAELYNFMSEVQDEIRVRSAVMKEPGITNLVNRGSGFVTGDVVGQKPGSSSKNFRPSQAMRRSAAKSSNDVMNFDVLLRNSYIKINFVKPSKMEMGSLINDIRRTVVGYVRKVNNNNAVIARVAAAMEIWKFVSTRITSCSVSDIVDFTDLINLITLSDIDRIATALLESFNTRGVNMNLRCLNSLCDWQQFALIDPSTLNQIRPGCSNEDAALYANLFNGTVKLTTAEVQAKRRSSNMLKGENRVYNEDRSTYFEVAEPTLGEAFSTFEFFVGEINPQLADIRAKVSNPDEYNAQVGMVYANLGATEYMHWVSTYVEVAPPGSEEEDKVWNRWEVEDPEFDQGIYDIILDDPIFNRNLTKFILNKTPFMTRTFTGVQNYECPKCKQNSADHQDPEKYLDRLLGYTPVDPIMSFFILTQLKMLSQVVEARTVMSEALSD